ncbi:hypothetical protein GCM10027275_39080 [Rhabdobacter roseus]|uniref:Uncharacterized protein n=1 Tax=Rhabdobacter roseus TaxID=1655419 RepID=A0A840TWH4_9BACT|nr:hypothetical protein [Rhabdobacter roseus]MBB5285613.1 hypothetical protein [Rhabdobacter roseus]
MKKKDDNLRKLIQQAGPDQPAPDFNELVMRAVRTEAERASSLHALLQQSTPEPPSPAFVQRVMAQVEAAAPKPVEPVISKNAWYWIAACFVLLVVASLVVAPETQPAASAFWNQTGHAFSGFTQAIAKVPLLYPLTIIAACALLLLDYFIRQRVLYSRELGM